MLTKLHNNFRKPTLTVIMRLQNHTASNNRSIAWSRRELIWIIRSWKIALFSFAVLLQSASSEYTDDCRSVRGKLGTCVPLNTCPLFSNWLKERPLVKENIRQVVRYTCYFDIRNPKVCCPNDSLYRSQDGDEVGFRIGAPSRIPELKHDRKLTFPTQSISFPSPVSNTLKPLKTNNQHLPLSFPTDIPTRGKFINKNVDTYYKTDFRRHPNFRLIPELSECSNAVKLDSLFETYGTYPWIALIGLKRRRSLDFDHFCAGIIINNKYILSSAHCYQQANPRYVRLGEYDLNTLIDEGNDYLPQSRREDVRIEKLTLHPEFNPVTYANDIALIRLEKPLELNTTFIKPACLPFMNEYDMPKENRINMNNVNDFDGMSAWVAGWSRHSWDGLYSKGSNGSVIEEAFVDFTVHDKCRHDYPHMSALNARTQFCVGGKGRRNSCVADSGGPLMIPIQVPSKITGFSEPKFFMLGLLSHGPTGYMCQNAKYNEGRSLKTSVYTRISKYLSWILDNIQD